MKNFCTFNRKFITYVTLGLLLMAAVFAAPTLPIRWNVVNAQEETPNESATDSGAAYVIAGSLPGGTNAANTLYTFNAPPAATRLVATTGTDSGDCISAACATIAYAIGQAVAGDTISIAAGTYTQLGITVDKDLTITGAAAPTTIVQANAAPNTAADRVFFVPSGVTASISGLTIRHGNTLGGGGGIVNSGTLTVANSTISNNSATGFLGSGGGIRNSGTLTVTNSTISNNSATDSGGGIYSFDFSSTLTVTNSTISNNSAPTAGGGILSQNGTSTVTNSTISGNSATFGGGIYYGSGTVNSRSSILAGNTSTLCPDFCGTLTSQGYNLIGNTSGSTISGGSNDILNVNPLLGPLAYNGGPTQTHALLDGSPAIDKGINSLSLTTDQRGIGFARTIDDSSIAPAPGGDNTDIGAYEATPPPTVTSVNPTSGSTAGGTSVTITGTNLTGATAVSFGGTPCVVGSNTATQIVCTTGARAAGLVDVIVTTPGGNSANTTADDYTYITPCVTNPVVTTNTDSGAGSLRNAIAVACAGSTITFDMNAVVSPIGLTSGNLVVDKNLTIQGPGAGVLAVSNTITPVTYIGPDSLRIFKVQASVTATISGLTIRDGKLMWNYSTPSQDCNGEWAVGGGILNSGNLTVDHVVVRDNKTWDSKLSCPQPGQGNGIFNFGTLTVNSSVINDNRYGNEQSYGGGISNHGLLYVNDSTITNNRIGVESGAGGGIYNAPGATAYINRSTISNHEANGIANGGQLYVDNSTISGNATGGISNVCAFARVTNSTITNNSAAGPYGGFWTNSICPGGSNVTEFRNTIVAGNAVGDFYFDPQSYIDTESPYPQAVSLGNNLIGIVPAELLGIPWNSGFNAPGDQRGSPATPINPRLGPLANNGGPTQTHALLDGGAIPSPAINAGTATGAPSTDQRGAARVGVVDIGAFEVNNTANGGSFVAVLPVGSQIFPYLAQITANNGAFTYSVSSGTLPNGISLTTNVAPTAVVALSGTATQNGIFNFAITATNGANSNVTNYRLQILGPTSASVSISGRVLTPDGNGVRNAIVQLTDLQGNTRTVRTSSFGYYRFDDVEAGQTYVVGVASKRYVFTPRTISVADELSDVDFMAIDTLLTPSQPIK